MLGALPASQITGQTIERFASEKLESGRLDGTGGLSAKNVRDILSIIKMTLDIGFADEILTKKVSFAKPRVPAKKIEILSPEAHRGPRRRRPENENHHRYAENTEQRKGDSSAGDPVKKTRMAQNARTIRRGLCLNGNAGPHRAAAVYLQL